MDSEHSAKARTYQRIKLRLQLIQMAIGLGYLLWLVASEIPARLAEWVAGLTAHPDGQFLIFVTLLAGLHGLLQFPLRFYSGYVLEHRFGLSQQSLARWFVQRAKASLVGLVIGLPLALIFYRFLRLSPQWWWLWTALILFVVSVLLARLAPVLLFPIFYRFEPLTDGQLQAKLGKLLEEHGLQLSGLFQFNFSRDTRKANAALAGLGKTRRIILADTLLNQFSPEEIFYVVAHEVGHHVHRHIRKGILIQGSLVFLGLYLVHRAHQVYLIHSGLAPHSLEALPMLALLFNLYSLFITPAGNWLSRRFEYQADAFALRQLGQPQPAISALEKLARLNLADPDPPPVVEFFFYSHPSIQKRIRAMQRSAPE